MKPRILSLLPAATEMACLLGLRKHVVGISHDSDYPAYLTAPKVTTTLLSQNLTSREIDEEVRKYEHKGQSIFHIDQKLLSRFNPDIVLTQELCSVCAPSFTEVKRSCKILAKPYFLISLEPETVEDIFDNIQTIADHTNRTKSGRKLINNFSKRITFIKNKTTKLEKDKRPSVLVIEWIDPLMIAGHWVPQMVEYAGGLHLMTKTGEKSRRINWNEVIKINPDFIIIAPCGFTIDKTLKEILLLKNKPHFSELKAYKKSNIFLVNGDSYVTRPGPRIIDGIEIFSEIFHTTLFPKSYNNNCWQRLN